MARSGSRWQWYAGTGAILLFIILLIIRLGIPEKLFTMTEKTISLPQENISAGEAWLNITQDGRKIGYANRMTARTKGGFSFAENIYVRINTMGIVQSLTMRTMTGPCRAFNLI